jgi:hypothetical protein
MSSFIQKEATKHIIKEITTFDHSSLSNYIILACSCTVGTVSHLHNKQVHWIEFETTQKVNTLIDIQTFRYIPPVTLAGKSYQA